MAIAESPQPHHEPHHKTNHNPSPSPELTPRAILSGLLIGTALCFSNMYFGLQTGWVTMGSLQSALLGYGLLGKLVPYLVDLLNSVGGCGWWGSCGSCGSCGSSGRKVPLVPFSAKENVVLQTTAVATATMPLAAGFVGVIPALRMLAEMNDENYENDDGGATPTSSTTLSAAASSSAFEPFYNSPLALFSWCLAIGFFGVFIAPPLRQQTILREKLPFPSGTATAEIIRQLHGLTNGDAGITGGAGGTGGKGGRSTGIPHGSGSGYRNDDDEQGKEVELITETTPLMNLPTIGTDDDSSFRPIDIPSLSHPPEPPSSSPSPSNHEPAWHLLFYCFLLSSLYTLLANFIPIIKNIPIFNYIPIPSSTSLTLWSWTLQPSPSYIGQGMIMGPHTALSMFLGAALGWGILGPLAKNRGWAPGDIHDLSNGATGWLLWVSLGMMVADSMVSLGMLVGKVMVEKVEKFGTFGKGRMRNGRHRRNGRNGSANDDDYGDTDEELDPAPPNQRITWKLYLPGLLLSTILCTTLLSPNHGPLTPHIPHLPPIPPLLTTLSILSSLLLSLLALRALGETDLNPVSGISKLTQLLFALLAPHRPVTNLVAGAIAESAATSAGEMMQDFKCGHLIRASDASSSSPKAQFIAQLVGTLFSCIVTPMAWRLYDSVYEIPGKEFPAPMAGVWLDMAEVVSGAGGGVAGGVGSGGGMGIPQNVLPVALTAATISALLPFLQTALAKDKQWMVPSAMAAAIGMYVTPNWTLPRVIGGMINFLWRRWDPRGQERYMIVVASGFVLGEGLTSIGNAVMRSWGVTWVWCGGCPEGFCSGCP